MKQLFLFFLMIGLYTNIFSQQSYTLLYTGPKSTDDLRTILANDPNTVITTLTTDEKNSLITYMAFAQNRVAGFSGSDANIEKLYGSNMGDVLAEILQTKVYLNSTPAIRNYNVVISNDPNAGLSRGVCSWCTNCAAPASFPIGCCGVGGNGCCDILNPELGVHYSN